MRSNNEYPDSENRSPEFRAQPRKAMWQKKNMPDHGLDDDKEKRHYSHRREPAKNAVRMQLRRIEHLF